MEEKNSIVDLLSELNFIAIFSHIRFIEEINEVFSNYDCIVALDNVQGAQKLETYQWDPNLKYLLCFGHEGHGLPQEILDKCNLILEIFQMGSVRSLNVSVAAGIVMHDYCVKTKNLTVLKK